MRRLQLFEFEDQPWCPRVLRNAVTGYVDLVSRLTRQMRVVAPAIRELLASSGETVILDLCSGSGGTARELGRALASLGAPTAIVLSDLYPDASSHRELARTPGAEVRVHDRALDATAVPAELAGVRTMFNAFHHFEPQAARAILASAAAARRPMAVVEFVERRPLALLGVLLSPLLVLVLMPFVRPLRWRTLAFTYVVPLVSCMVLWDGLVSWLRVYSLAELQALAAAAASPGYRWQAGRWGAGPLRVTYLLGQPA